MRLGVEQPEGEHRQPQINPGGPNDFTLAWQIFAHDGQSIHLASVQGDATPETGLRISPATHRFAADPSLCGKGNWSVVTWVDDHLDGGTGEVGFAEIYWPSNPSGE